MFKDYKKIDEVPFNFIRRRVSVVREHQGQRFMVIKGAPEEITKISQYYKMGGTAVDLADDVRVKIEQKYRELSAKGYRVLAVAYKRLAEDKPAYMMNDEKGMAFLDPPKETAGEALQLLKKAGIELKILAGDNELVTRRVCECLGFEIKGVITGSELDKISDEALIRVVEKANVFCRLTPSQKTRIMNALKRNGHVVEYIGDGINDAPSIRNADVGISVENAVDVARESADSYRTT